MESLASHTVASYLTIYTMDESVNALQSSSHSPLSHPDMDTAPVQNDTASGNPKTATSTVQRSRKLALLAFFSTSEDPSRRQKLRQSVEICGLLALIALVWGLLFLPTIIYHVPVRDDDASSATNVSTKFTGISSAWLKLRAAKAYLDMTINCLSVLS